MPYVITPGDLAAFQRCRRQWDFGARGRQNLVPLRHAGPPDLGLAIRAALDIYYFPGMWDWQRQVTLPLVLQGFERAVASQRGQRAAAAADRVWQQQLDTGRALLGRYFEWAPTVDRFSPVVVQAEYDVTIVDPDQPQLGVLTADGEAIRYRGRIDMLAVDANDAYWVVRHQLVDGDWPPTGDLVDDEEAIAACWAWEQFYLGMAVTGTIYNEVRADTPAPAEARPSPRPPRRARGLRRLWPASQPARSERVRQHDPSGGGRSIPQHRRMYAMAREPSRTERIEQHTAPQFRRTWIRRSPAEVAGAGRRLAGTAAEMTATDVTPDPSPSPAICPACAYLGPCQAMTAGHDPTPLLRSGYRERPGDKLVEGRLGGGAWGTGRGAAPPRFRSSP